MRRFALVAAFLLTSCDPVVSTQETVPSANAGAASKSSPVVDTQPACESAGGQWLPDCSPNAPRCLMPYADAGKQCTDSSECESNMCITDLEEVCTAGEGCKAPHVPKPGESASGICKRNNERCGSFIEIKGGLAQVPYHID